MKSLLKVFALASFSLLAITSVLSATNFCGTITANTTWTTTGSPYIITCTSYVQGSAAPVLTINDLVEVKFNAGTSLIVGQSNPGGIKVMGNGGPNQGVTFKSNVANPGPGNWAGLYLYSQATATTELNFVTIKHATNALSINGTSPKVNHLIAQDNSGWGILFSGTGNPNIYQTSFINNTIGGVSTSTPIKVIYSWWNSASGPTCSGCPGTGQAINGSVTYEPWLTATPSLGHYFETFSILNRTFNPNIGAKVTLNFTLNTSGNWTVTILNYLGQTVRTFNASGTVGSVLWDGKNGSQQTQPDGTYTYKLESTTNQGKVATPANGLTVIDSTKALTVTNFLANPLYFSPNGNGIQETTTITATINYDDAAWTLNIKNSPTQQPPYVKTVTGSGAMSYVWDGKNTAGVIQADGIYYLDLVVTEGTSNLTVNTTTVIDKTAPVSSITNPTQGAIVSNVYQNGSMNKDIIGTATDTNLNHWTLEYGAGAVPTVWNLINSGSSGISNNVLGTWATEGLANGTYAFKLSVFDNAGNVAVTNPLRTVTLGNFTMTQNVRQIDGHTVPAAKVFYTSIVPFTLNETIKIYSDPGRVNLTKTILNNQQRPAGTYNTDFWDGSKSTGACCAPDGPYFMFADITSGGFSMTWDVSNKPIGSALEEQDGEDFTFSSFDPFKNQPLTFTYNFSLPGRVRIVFRELNVPIAGKCHFEDDCVGLISHEYRQYCLIENEYQESGPHTIRWAGVDNMGKYSNDLRCVGIVRREDTPPDYPQGAFGGFAQNAIVLYGTKPLVTNVAASPSAYGPYNGNQQITFNLTTYNSINADIVTKFQNLECSAYASPAQCILRTITQTNQSPGAKTVQWDGKADNGMWVAPGQYLVTVTVTDTLGNTVSGQTLTVVQY